MVQRMLTVTRCPLCGEETERVSPAMLQKNPHYHNAELVITKRGLKQYIHTSCWYKMIAVCDLSKITCGRKFQLQSTLFNHINQSRYV